MTQNKQSVIFTVQRTDDETIRINLEFEPGLCGESKWDEQTETQKELHIKAVKIANYVMEALENE